MESGPSQAEATETPRSGEVSKECPQLYKSLSFTRKVCKANRQRDRGIRDINSSWQVTNTSCHRKQGKHVINKWPISCTVPAAATAPSIQKVASRNWLNELAMPADTATHRAAALRNPERQKAMGSSLQRDVRGRGLLKDRMEIRRE